jgi:hypothetical protein
MTLITPEYKALNAALHAQAPDYGTQSRKWAEVVDDLAKAINLKTILDYGCGKGLLAQSLTPKGYTVNEYDPCIEGKETPPEPHEFVVCTDVLEHIEPECLDAVLKDLQRVTVGHGFYVIATRPARRLMPDGTNTHRIIETREWWLEKLMKHFQIVRVGEIGDKAFAVVVKPI